MHLDFFSPFPYSVRLLHNLCLSAFWELAYPRSSDCPVFCVCGVLRDPPTHKHPVRPSSRCQHQDHSSTTTAPRVSVVPEESIYPSFTTLGRSTSSQPQRTAEADAADLQLIRARQSQGQSLPPYQTSPRDPTSPEMEEQWFPDPGPPKDRGGWENHKPWSYGTPKQTAPTSTSTPQTAPRLELQPTPQATPTPTVTATPGADPRPKGTAATTSSSVEPQAAKTTSLQ